VEWVDVMGNKKLLVLAGLLLALLIVPVFSILGVVDVSKFSLGSSLASSTVEPASPGPTPLVFVDPDMIVKDYDNDPGYQIGDPLQVHVNVSMYDTELFAWQVNVTWDTAMLNFTGLSYGDFLAQTGSPDGTSGSKVDIVDASNDTGYASIAETILGEYPGINETGRLVTLDFLILGYGWTYLNISVSGGVLPTILLDSTGGTITYDRLLVPIFPSDGYFRNVIPGDMTDDSPGVLPDYPDGDVDGFDLGEFADAYGTSVGQPNYNHLGDLTDDSPGVPPDNPDGDVDGFDLGVFADNYGRP